MYTRYELYLDGEPQEVGFIVGLKDTGLSRDECLDLIHDFDTDLPYPSIDKEVWKKRPLAYFTQYGVEYFQETIQRILDVYKEIGLFEVVKIESSLDGQEIVYEDDYQVVVIKK